MPQVVYSVTATHATSDEVSPMTVVDVSPQDAIELMDSKIAEDCSNPDMWITYDPVEHTLPDAMDNPPRGTPVRVKKLRRKS